MTSLWIDIFIIFALFAALAWGVILARRVARLQAALVELAPALQAFCDAVDQSTRSVDEIRRETDRLQQEHEAAGKTRATEAPKPVSDGKKDHNDLVRRFFEAARIRQDGRD